MPKIRECFAASSLLNTDQLTIVTAALGHGTINATTFFEKLFELLDIKEAVRIASDRPVMRTNALIDLDS